ncbi:MAG: phenylalanine--tRNA ligase subunit beta [Bacilli bacterium]
MLASYNLLKKYVDLDGITPEEAAAKLTFAGLEVEGIEHIAYGTNLVIGQIISVENHPDSDHLHVLMVDEGPKYGIHQIVCGAPNVRVGLKVIVARNGAKLDAIGATIKPTTIRGVESDGMCCSLVELGVNKMFLKEEQINGIEELSEDSLVGEEEVLKYLNLDDTILDINVLANRSDVLAIFSLAKELGALFDRKVNIPTPTKYNDIPSSVTTSSETEDCKQFSLKVVRGVKTKPSPKWLQSFLIAQGIRSINNIVDIGNFVMILTGQPIHMYDMDKCSSSSFVVKKGYNETIVALDDKEYKVDENDIVVTNNNQIVCLAGIMGCKSVAVDENTVNIGIESASFKGSTIRRTTIKTGLSSDSSAHFIKGINPYQDQFVLDLSAQLLKDLADATTIESSSSYNEVGENNIQIPCSKSYINKRLGTSFDLELIKSILEKLQIKIVTLNDDEFIAFPPDHRIDLRCDADLSEEVIRYVGFGAIKSILPMMPTTTGGYNPFQKKKNKIRDFLLNNGVNEALTYTLINPKNLDEFVLLNNDNPYVIMNPMTVDHSVVRKGIVHSLLEAVKFNLDHQQKDMAFFEIAEVITKDNYYQELAIVLNGKRSLRGQINKVDYNFFDAHGLMIEILNILGIEPSRYKEERITNSPYYHPGRSVKLIVNGKDVAGVCGEIHPNFQKEYGPCYVVNLNLDLLFNMKTPSTKMSQISKFPAVVRDLAFVVSKDVLVGDIIKTIKKTGKNIVRNVDVFDIYQGEHLGQDLKSIAVSITYQDPNKTLKDVEINEVEQSLINVLSKTYNAELRK